MKEKIVVIGGGAAGMMAAITALENKAEVILVEGNNRLGKKVLVTGNGRCNLTNINVSATNYHGQNPLLVNNIFSQFDNNDTIKFFNDLGIVTKVEPSGKVFPMSNQASSVVEILTHRLKDLGAEIVYENKVKSIKKKGLDFIVETEKGDFRANKVILATGGVSVPALGSDGTGHKISEKLGHKVTPLWPSLVQLRLKGDFFDDIKGVKFDGSLRLFADNKEIRNEPGEVLFTHYGLTGPAALKISRLVKENIEAGKKVSLKVSLLEGFDTQSLDKFLEERFLRFDKKALKTSFLGFLQKRLIPIVLKEAGISNPDKKCAEISKKERQALVEILLNWELEVTDTNSFKDAQVTAGGVNTAEIDQKTLESKIVPGLYFAGEILDIDGDSGGYNLQWAWSSGYVAAKNCVFSLKS